MRIVLLLLLLLPALAAIAALASATTLLRGKFNNARVCWDHVHGH